MTKIRKQKRKKRFRANVNRKRLRNKLQKLPKIECEEIENSWELKRSMRTNLNDMGLAYDPNEVLKIPSTKRGIVKVVKNGKKLVDNETEEEDIPRSDDDLEKTNTILREKIHVANKLEADAKAPRERMFRLPKSQVQFVTYLMEKYGDDYKAMARDRKNHYQMTWCQIRAKINKFKSIPEQYAEYLLKSGEIVLDDPTPLSETRRKLGEENLKKFCTAKKRKLPKEQKKPIWDVESENEEFCTEDQNSSSDKIHKERKSSSNNGLKKLKLFSDDEEDDDEQKNVKNVKKKKSGGSIEDEKLESKKTNKNIDPSSVSSKVKQNRDISLNGTDKSKEEMKGRIKKLGKIEKSQSSDSDSEDLEELEGDVEGAEGFLNLSDMSEEELSEDDVLDDGEFVTDSDESD